MKTVSIVDDPLDHTQSGTKDDFTAVMLARKNGNEKLVQLLLANGVSDGGSGGQDQKYTML